MLPVPNASLVTLTSEWPSVTQSVAVAAAAVSGKAPAPASAAPSPVFRKSRLERLSIGHPSIGRILPRSTWQWLADFTNRARRKVNEVCHALLQNSQKTPPPAAPSRVSRRPDPDG